MSKCILSKLKNAHVKHVQSASSSIFVTGLWNGEEVMVKMSLATDPEDNGLEIERKCYMFVKSTLGKLTPHLLSGINQGFCNIKDFDMKRDSDVISDYLELVTVEVDEIKETQKEEEEEVGGFTFHTSKEESSEEEEFEASSELDLALMLQLVKQKEFKHLAILPYVITPKINAPNLLEFLRKNKVNNQFAVEVAIQMAQTLSVLQDYSIQHNDLHAENIFLLQNTEPFTYNTPLKFRLTSAWKVMVFDFDRVARPIVWENTSLHSELCKELGQCNTFIAKWDWYMFLTYFIGLLEEQNVTTSLRDLVYGGSYGDITIQHYKTAVGRHAALGRACKCVATKDFRYEDTVLTKCTECHADFDRLSLVKSCQDFISEYVANPQLYLG
jgi:Protein tyrosine and serine/threonine kinase